MKFINFVRIDKGIEIIKGNDFYDLHNVCEFVHFSYNVILKEVILEWKYINREDLPLKLTLTFQNVTNFSVSERDDELPFSEDTCLSCLYINDEDAGVMGNNAELEFQSGMELKVKAESVAFNIE